MKFLHVHNYATAHYWHAHERDALGAQWIVSVNITGEDRSDFHVHPDLMDLEILLAEEERKGAKA